MEVKLDQILRNQMIIMDYIIHKENVTRDNLSDFSLMTASSETKGLLEGLPECPYVNGDTIPRCMTLKDRKYCARYDGVCGKRK